MPSVAERTSWSVLPQNPFVGLRPFESDESILFFGRATQTQELLDRLQENRFVAVVGSSGCGKSSLIRAGLIPNLKAGFLVHDADRWTIAVMKPGETPLYSLAAALAQGSAEGRAAAEAVLAEIRESGLAAVLDHIRSTPGNFLLLVDQFEEIFRSVKSDATPQQIDDATDFAALLLRLAEQDEVPAYVVLSMRTDFLGDCDTFFGLPEALNRSQYLVPRLTRLQRREVIEGPIRLYQREVSLDLVDRVLNDAGERSDQLPVLQHALMLTWEEFLKEGGNEVGLRHYQVSGGITGALNRHAEQAMEGMSPNQERLTERIFRALTDTDDRGRRVRRPVLLSQLTAITGASPDQIKSVVDRFQSGNRSFLVLSETETADDPRIDVSHESLFRQWKRLEGWVEAEARSKEEYLRLVQSARLHQQGREGLMRDPALTVAEQWRANERPSEAWAARYGEDFRAAVAYLEASTRQCEAERTRHKRRTYLTLGSAILAAAAIIIYFWTEARNAERAAHLRAAFSAEDPLVRALAVAELGFSREAEQAVGSIRQIATAPIPLAVLGDRDSQKPDRALMAGWFGSGDHQVATISYSGELSLWPADGNGNPVASKLPAAVGLSAIALSSDRQWMAVGSQDGAAWIARSDGAKVLDLAEPNDQKITALAFSSDAVQVMAGYENREVRIWNRDGKPGRVLTGQGAQHDRPVSSVQFDQTGKRALSASWDGTAIVWDLGSGQALAVLGSGSVLEGGQHREIDSAAISPDGRWVVCGYQDGLALIWRSDGKGTPTRLEGHSGAVSSVAFSPDASIVVTGSKDENARVWNLRLDKSKDGTTDDALTLIGSPAVLSGHMGPLTGVGFSQDGSKIITTSGDGTARLWWSQSREPRILGKHAKTVQSVDFSPDGKKVVSASDDKTARVWSLDGALAPRTYGASTYVRSAAFSSDGSKVIVGSEDGIFSIWDPETNSQNVRPEKSDVLSVALSPDGTRIVTGTRSKEINKLCCVRVWSADGSQSPYEQLPNAEGHAQSVYHAAFSRDGSRIVTASQDQTARIFTLDHRAKGLICAMTLPHPSNVMSAVFSPDGAKVATASVDHLARIWNMSSPAATKPREFQHLDEVWQVAFSSDGRRLLTASIDKTAKIWDAEGFVAALVLSHPAGVRSAAFQRPADSLVVTGSEDGWVRLWRITARDLVEYLRGSTSACLTAEKRIAILSDSPKQALAGYQACESAHGRTAH